MTNAFTLDDLHKALDDRFGPFVFVAGKEKFTLQQVTRIAKDKRKEVRTKLQSLEDQKETLDEDEVLDILKDVIRNVLVEDNADLLFDLLDDDLTKITILIEKWVEKTQAGEA